MIQDDGIVSTGAGTHSPHPLQVTAKSQERAGGSPDTESSIGEQKANCPASPKCFRNWQEDSSTPVRHVAHPETGRLGISPTHSERSLSDSAQIEERLGPRSQVAGAFMGRNTRNQPLPPTAING